MTPVWIVRRALLLEDAIDVLDEEQRGGRQGVDQGAEAVVVHQLAAQAQHGDGELQLAGQR